MSIIRREIVESPLEQGANEEVKYPVLIHTSWGTPTSGYSFKVEDATENYADTTATNADGSATFAVDTMTTPKVKALVAGHRYIWRMRFTNAAGQIYEMFCQLEATR